MSATVHCSKCQCVLDPDQQAGGESCRCTACGAIVQLPAGERGSVLPASVPAGPPTPPVHVRDLRKNRMLLWAGVCLSLLIAAVILWRVIAFINQGGPDETIPTGIPPATTAAASSPAP